MELFERILKIVELFDGNSRTQAAVRLGVPQPTFNTYLNSSGQLKIKKILLDKINLVYPQVSRDWLYFGEGEMLKSDTAHATPAPISVEVTQPVQSPAPMPLLGFASCSILGWQGTMTIPVSVEPPTWNAGMIAVMASGESMLPAGIGHGHVCYCDPSKTPGPGEAVYVETTDNLGTIKLFCGWSDRGGERYLNLQGWQDRQPDAKTQETVTIEIIECHVRRIAPVIYVRRRL